VKLALLNGRVMDLAHSVHSVADLSTETSLHFVLLRISFTSLKFFVIITVAAGGSLQNGTSAEKLEVSFLLPLLAVIGLVS
jgi:hypothetical protein